MPLFPAVACETFDHDTGWFVPNKSPKPPAEAKTHSALLVKHWGTRGKSNNCYCDYDQHCSGAYDHRVIPLFQKKTA
jgi:hypothetical protein